MSNSTQINFESSVTITVHFRCLSGYFQDRNSLKKAWIYAAKHDSISLWCLQYSSSGHNKLYLICRYVLVTAGPVFTEEMWRLACCALQDAFSATLEPVKVTVTITFTEVYTVQTSRMSFDKKLFFVTSVSAKSFLWKQLLRQGCQTQRPAEFSFSHNKSTWSSESSP